MKEQRIIENASVFDFQLSPEDLQLMVCFIDFSKLFRVASVPGLPHSNKHSFLIMFSILQYFLYRVV